MAQGAIHLRVDLLHHIEAVVQPSERILVRDLREDAVLHHQVEILPLQDEEAILQGTQPVVALVGDAGQSEDLVQELPLGLVEGPAVFRADDDSRRRDAHDRHVSRGRRALIELQASVQQPRQRAQDAARYFGDSPHSLSRNRRSISKSERFRLGARCGTDSRRPGSRRRCALSCCVPAMY